MTREFVWTTAFLAGWNRCGFDTQDDLVRLEDALLEDPKAGKVIQGTGGARKYRFAFEDQGKSGSARIIYVDFEIGEKICGLAAYAKSDKGNLTEAEKKTIKKLIDTIEPYYNKPHGKEE
ncbi:MAG: type II toxin-antitoxin system RelE/ParE family toxin [Oscillospiraceae bacterium]|nr:type II toxin-antitoxin system RelE/ParE family toxin [Oscillospiraceae bacterium]